MKLKELMNKYRVNENLEMKVAYLLAYFGTLSIEDEDLKTIYEDELTSYNWEEIEVSEYDLECGGYLNHIWFSLDKAIKCLVECDERYE